MESRNHDHQHAPNRFAVIPTAARLNAHPDYTGRGVTIAFLDSGFYPHPDLESRIICYRDISGERPQLNACDPRATWQWHGTQTSVAAAGDGQLSNGVYRGLACKANLVLVKASQGGSITEDNISRGIEWVIENRTRFNIRVLNISLGGDEDVPCSKSIIDQAAEEAIRQGIVVVAAAGNAGNEGRHSIPPANSPSVITVGGYTDHNLADGRTLDLYHSNFGVTAGGILKPEIVAPAMWVAAPILPGTPSYEQAEALSQLAAAFDYELQRLAIQLREKAELPNRALTASVAELRALIETSLTENKIVATHYQHVDGTSFAAPIVSSIVAQMIEANPQLGPATIKNILISTASRITSAAALRQGFGVVNARRAVEAALSEQHKLDNGGCASYVIRDGRMRFVYHDDGAASVALAGDFNNWDPRSVVLKRDEAGLWVGEIDAPLPGKYQYKFVINGQSWLEDPNNGMKAPDSYGGLNSVLIVE